jgi:glycosyltransferase involved in cell wall biosynthesis
VRALVELGYEVDLLTLPVGDKLNIPGVRIIRTPNLLKIKNMPIGPSAFKVMFDFFLLFKGLRLAFKNNYDIIHCIEDAGILGMIISVLTGKSRLIFEIHSDPFSYKKGWLQNAVLHLYVKIERFVIRHADAVIATGPGLVKQAQELVRDVSVHHIFDIASSLVESEKDKCSIIRKKLQQRDDEQLITFVGSFAIYQGVDLIFKSVPMVMKRNPKARFVIIGGSDNEIAEKKSWLRQKRVGGAVTFVGKVPPDELPNYLAASDILLSPRMAGVNTPLKLLDYLKAGQAIVATDVSSNTLILDNNSTAVIVSPEPEAFAEGICYLLDNEKRRIRIAQNGKKLSGSRYSFTEFKKRMNDCYNALL